MVKIRLSRGGRVHRPVYTIVATDSRSARDGRNLERLGQYDPNSNEVLVGVKVDKISKYVQNGALLSDTVRTLFKRHNIQLS